MAEAAALLDRGLGHWPPRPSPRMGGQGPKISVGIARSKIIYRRIVLLSLVGLALSVASPQASFPWLRGWKIHRPPLPRADSLLTSTGIQWQ